MLCVSTCPKSGQGSKHCLLGTSNRAAERSNGEDPSHRLRLERGEINDLEVRRMRVFQGVQYYYTKVRIVFLSGDILNACKCFSLWLKCLTWCKSKLQWGTTSQWSEWPSLKSLEIANAGKGLEKGEPKYTVGGNVNCCSRYEKQYGGSSKNRVAIWSSNTTLGYIPRENCNSNRYVHPGVHAILFTIAKQGSNINVHRQKNG